MSAIHPSTGGEHACCHSKPPVTAPAPTEKAMSNAGALHHPDLHAHSHHGAVTGWAGAARITLHCLTGCAIGEWLGLTIGLLLGLETVHRIVLAVVLAYLFGFALTLYPLMRAGMAFRQAFRIVWVGEAVSIGVMEVVMNFVDYHMGGMGPGMSLLHPQYWIAFGVAAVAGYLVAWPVNFWLLKSSVKQACH